MIIDTALRYYLTLEGLLVLLGIFILLVQSSRASYWKARAVVLDRELEKDRHGGWREEARFWRNHFNPKASKLTLDQEDMY